MGDRVDVSSEQAAEAEARILHDEYGITVKDAQRLVADARNQGGLDRLLRERARKGKVEEIYRTKDPA